ncbi:MAG: hypothetical protein LIR10_10015 [Bacillota bacterium]|nr:hypothetical protein [Bacillota bacterium]
MLDRLKSKLKQLLNGAPKDTSTDQVYEPEHRVDIGITASQFAEQLAKFSRVIAAKGVLYEYQRNHAGMTSYQKWHKHNKKWR